MQDPIEELAEEHRLIGRVLAALEAAAGREIGFAFYERVLDFMGHFAEQLHHAKEEDRLFPLLAEKGLSAEGGPVGLLVSEHRIGRGALRRMRQLLAAGRLDSLRASAERYAEVMRAHIAREDEVLEQARVLLGEEDRARLAAAFREVEGGEEFRGRYARLAANIAAEAGEDA